MPERPDERPVRRMARIAVLRAFRKRDQSCLLNGRPLPLISPASRSSGIRLRVARSVPMAASVKAPVGAITRAPRLMHRSALDEAYTPLSHYCSRYYVNSALYPVIRLLERTAGFARRTHPQNASPSSKRWWPKAPTGPRRRRP